MIVVSFGLVTGRGLVLVLLAFGFPSENVLPEVSTSMLKWKNEQEDDVLLLYYLGCFFA